MIVTHKEIYVDLDYSRSKLTQEETHDFNHYNVKTSFWSAVLSPPITKNISSNYWAKATFPRRN